MSKIDAYCSQPHYLEHLLPIWQALEPENRGRFRIFTDRRLLDLGKARGIAELDYGGSPSRNLTLIAGAIDIHQTWRAVLVEHGAGQTYEGIDHPGYAGGEGRGRCAAFVVPNERTAWANSQCYPSALQIIAAPRVEQLRQLSRLAEDLSDTVVESLNLSPELIRKRPDLIVSRHWDAPQICPEARSAWPEWKAAVAFLAAHTEQRISLHAHPRAIRHAYNDAKELALAFHASFESAVTAGHPRTVYAIDNSSTAYEWAAIGRPVLLLNSRHYRPDIHHGLRFWDQLPGPHIWPDGAEDHPMTAGADKQAERLTEAIDAARNFADRARIVAEVFPVIDGSAQLAAAQIQELA